MRHRSLILLSHDHHHGLALALRCRKQALGQLKPMGAEGLRARAKEFRDFFAKNLTQHFRAEEEALFPPLRALMPDSEPLLNQLVGEHQQIRAAISNLEAETGLGKVIFDLGDLLERHIRKEERELFPLFEQHADRFDAAAVGEQIKAILEPPGRSSDI
jgi:hemerythrin-like domain-containing protein